MQWETVENAGFSPTGVKPWLPVNTDFQQVNTSTQKDLPDSLLNTYRQLLHIRASNPALHSGGFELVFQDGNSKDLLGYKRCYEQQEILVLMNFGKKRISISQPARIDQIIFKSGEITQNDNGDLNLGRYAAVILRI
jgi:alpha-glucosidase